MEEKKLKFLVHHPKLGIGGAGFSTMRMLNTLIKDGHEVDLVLELAGGELEEKLDKNINVTHLHKKLYIEKIEKNKEKSLKLLNLFVYGLPFLFARIRKAFIIKSLPKKKYDIGIVGNNSLKADFIGKADCTYRFHFVRTDLKKSNFPKRAKNNILKSAYKYKTDFFACVSENARQSFAEIFPDLKDKTITFYNFINKDEMLEKSLFGDPLSNYNKYDFKVVTVCRMVDESKGIFRMFEVYSKLREEGYFFYWFLVGDGKDKDSLEKSVKEKGYDDGFVLIGSTDNPFPYYKNADLVAALSYFEGLCIVVNEAKVMCKPVVCTNFLLEGEQIVDNVNGIVFNNDTNAIYDGFKNILNNKKCLENITNDFLPVALADDDAKVDIFRKLFKEIE